MESVWRIMEEYRRRLIAREKMLKEGFWALYSCSRGGYPGHIPLAITSSILAVMEKGITLGLYDPSARIYARIAGSVDKAVESLRRARREIRCADLNECRSGVSDSAIRVVLDAWKAVRQASTLIARGDLKTLLTVV